MKRSPYGKKLWHRYFMKKAFYANFDEKHAPGDK